MFQRPAEKTYQSIWRLQLGMGFFQVVEFCRGQWRRRNMGERTFRQWAVWGHWDISASGDQTKLRKV